jgi:protein-S-isoprenylcysteine O-methyltransferase Ste14
MMVFLPELKLGWLNGWLYLAFFYTCFGIYLLSCSRGVVKKLYSIRGWEGRYYRLSIFGKPFSIAALVLIILSPLRVNTILFWVSTIVYIAGFVIMFTALFIYRKTPVDEGVTGGIYQYSRNPQWIGLVLIFIGTCISCGNGLALLMMSVGIVLYHFRILGEESACLRDYGQSFQDYMDSVPRYFGLARKDRK